MKKAVVIILALILCLSLFACGKDNSNDIIEEITQKIAETFSSEYTAENNITIEVKPIGFDDELYVPFSAEDSKKAENIIKNMSRKSLKQVPIVCLTSI